MFECSDVQMFYCSMLRVLFYLDYLQKWLVLNFWNGTFDWTLWTTLNAKHWTFLWTLTILNKFNVRQLNFSLNAKHWTFHWTLNHFEQLWTFLLQPYFKFLHTQSNEKQSHSGNNERFFPDILKTKAFDHYRFYDYDKPAWRHYIAYYLQRQRHVFDRKNKPRKQDGRQHKRKHRKHHGHLLAFADCGNENP